MGKLTTHVLDTSTGIPASNLTIDLFYLSNTERELMGTFLTNRDGRVDQALMEGKDFRLGKFELLFHVGDYQNAIDKIINKNRFLDLIPIQFYINENADYHVPLLYSPYGYSTYRGS